MSFDVYVEKGYNKNLRCGFTTGTCAALASKASVTALLSGEKVSVCDVITPKGIEVSTRIEKCIIKEKSVLCSVIKDAGDDIDVTNGIEICAEVEKTDSGIEITGGKGVGFVTKDGLDCKKGGYAINSTPIKMITKEVKSVCKEFSYNGGVRVTISVPEGEKIAKKTFNQNLGIVGGISIIGTSGIVEPQSLDALEDSIHVELKVLKNSGTDKVIITPGNYGETFIKDFIKGSGFDVVKCSNFIGSAIIEAESLGFKEILLTAHLGKMIKLCGSMFNTHSYYGDCRMELLASQMILNGADADISKKVLQCATVDAGLDIIKDNSELFNATINSIGMKIENNIKRILSSAVKVGIVIFTNKHGLLYMDYNAKDILKITEDK